MRPDSSAMIQASGGADQPLRVGFSSGIWQGSRAGLPFNVVDGRDVPRTDVMISPVHHGVGVEHDFPIPHNPRYEGWPGKAWDQHLLVIDAVTCHSRELLNARSPDEDVLGIGGGKWWADGAATVDLRSNAPVVGQSTASAISSLAGLVRYDEVVAGDLGHALSAGLEQVKAREFVWPAMATDGRSERPDAMPMGSWLRLRADVDLSEFGPQARVVARALQEHGAVITDTGTGFTIAGEPDTRWDDGDLASLGSLTIADFDVIDATPMMVAPDSFQIRGN